MAKIHSLGAFSRIKLSLCVLSVVGGSYACVSAQDLSRLTFTEARNGQAFFSPDGRWISFVSNRSGSWQVWLMQADGAAPRQLTRSAGPVGWPSWSSDGSRILFYALDGKRGFQLFEIDREGGDSRRLFDMPAQNFRPLLSPDGERLLFDRYGSSEPANHDLFVLDLTTRELTQLTDHPSYDSDGRWSPDGRRILFHSDRDGEKTRLQVYVMAADGSGLERLTSGEAKNAYPSWSPDGNWIAYSSESNGSRNIWILDSHGANAHRLTDGAGYDGDPVWSPDGKRLLFATDRFGSSVELATVTVPAPPSELP